MIIKYEIQRSKRKTLSLFVLSNGKILIKAPLTTSDSAIQKFVTEKSEWIAKKQAFACAMAQKLPKLKSGEKISISGNIYTICLAEISRVRCDGEVLYLPVNSPKTAFLQYVKRVFKPYIAQKTQYFAQTFGFKYSQIRLSGATKRWGSCSGYNVISYSYGLALIPEYLIDYVICHELCHTVQKNHGRGFYALLQKVMPDYRQRVNSLKEYSALCSFFKMED